jgi:hypothetical protein
MATARYSTLTAAVTLRSLGVVYALAILSLWVQIDGLIGSRGILPVEAFLARVAARVGDDAFWYLPTLVWLAPGDGILHALGAAGMVLALVLAAGVVPTAALAGLWVIYLSLTVAGQDFLGFQWDNLLLETGLLAIVLVPPCFRLGAGRTRAASPFALFLFRWLVFRLMLGSGLVKLASGDPSWWPDLTALSYHYETTCLPVWVGWLVHQAPLGVHRASCALVLASELVVPFFVFGPRRLRLAAFWIFLAQQAGIAITGNYGFFNILTVVLCFSLLDDAAWPRRWRRGDAAPSARRPITAWSFGVVAPLGVVVFILGLVTVVGQLDRALQRFDRGMGIVWPPPILRLAEAADPFRSVNGYGLFARMTKNRPEIVVEGSDDAATWHPYTFRWKPGDVHARPRFVAPHQPRLDWQMWFAALGNARANPWFVLFLHRLLEGSPPVLGLLADNPFPNGPPRYVRAVLYDYRFTTRNDPSDAWWKRERLGLYAAPIGRQLDRASDRR